MCLTSIGHLSWGCCETLKNVAARSRESVVWFWSLEMKEILNVENKLSIISHTSFNKHLTTVSLLDKHFWPAESLTWSSKKQRTVEFPIPS